MNGDSKETSLSLLWKFQFRGPQVDLIYACLSNCMLLNIIVWTQPYRAKATGQFIVFESAKT